jgi:RimJ/RimL family protein N-acetyltransferase
VPAGPTVATARLVLRPFNDVDRSAFFELNTHPAVVALLGSSPSRAESDAMVERYTAEMTREGWGFWAVEIGWRFHPDYWSHGYASGAAKASLDSGSVRPGYARSSPSRPP